MTSRKDNVISLMLCPLGSGMLRCAHANLIAPQQASQDAASGDVDSGIWQQRWHDPATVMAHHGLLQKCQTSCPCFRKVVVVLSSSTALGLAWQASANCSGLRRSAGGSSRGVSAGVASVVIAALAECLQVRRDCRHRLPRRDPWPLTRRHCSPALEMHPSNRARHPGPGWLGDRLCREHTEQLAEAVQQHHNIGMAE